MKLKDLYKNEITRYINPVATVEELTEEHVLQEINEYFFTDKLIEHLHTFLDKILLQKRGRTGVWINGYYGSGKSHFLKYIYYCLHPNFSDKALNHFAETVREHSNPLALPVSDAKVKKLQKQIVDTQLDTIMFNIDLESGQRRDKNTITRIFYNKFNEFLGFNANNIGIARFEKYLAQRNLFEKFKNQVKESLELDWDENSDDAVAYSLEEILDIATALDSKLDRNSAQKSIENPTDFSIVHFVQELKKHLQTQKEDYRLVFLVDEVSQYIGSDTRLLLNLQTIVEEISDKCQNKVWIVCTAQQALSEVIGNAKKGVDDFGKILGRFEVQLSLESQQADLITKKRILAKNIKGNTALTDYFKGHKIAITNQFNNSNPLYKGYSGQHQEFVETYPFVPYHFALISEVIKSFSNAEFLQVGFSNTERSLIGMTHFVAQECAEEGVGYVVPFDAFFNRSFSDKMTHFAKDIIDKALRLEEVKADAFAQRVVKALFLISNLSSSQKRNFKANVANLAFIMMNQIDQVQTDIKQQIQKTLEDLVRNNVVSVSDGIYRFLGEEEIIVKNEIDNQTITTNDRQIDLRDLLFQPLFFPDSGKRVKSYVDLEGSSIKLQIKLDELDLSSTGDVLVQFKVYDPLSADELQSMALDIAHKDLIINVSPIFNAQTRKQFDQYVKINRYHRNNISESTGKRRDAIDTFKNQSKILEIDLKKRLKEEFLTLSYISNNRVESIKNTNATSTKQAFDAIVKKHLADVYNKRKLANGLTKSKSEFQKLARTTSQKSVNTPLPQAALEVNNYLNRSGTNTIVEEVLNHFSRIPFGWQDYETLHALFLLERKNKQTFKYTGINCDAAEFVERAVSSANRRSLTVQKAKEIDLTLVHNAVKTCNDLFNENKVNPTTDAREAAKAIKRQLNRQLDSFEQSANEFARYPFGHHFTQFCKELKQLQRIEEAERLFKELIKQEEKWLDTIDILQETQGFWKRSGKKYLDIKRFYEKHKSNFALLEDSLSQHANTLRKFFESNDQPFNHFPTTITQIHKNLSNAIEEKISSLQKEAVQQYEGIFDQLEAKQKELDIDGNIFPMRDFYLNNLRKKDSIAALQNTLLQADKFLVENIQKLHNAIPPPPPKPKSQEQVQTSKTPSKALVKEPKEKTTYNKPKETIRFKLSEGMVGQTLNTEADVKALVENIEAELMKEIKAGKMIIVE